MSPNRLLSAWRRPSPLAERDAARLETLLASLAPPRRGWAEALRCRHPRVVGVGIAYATRGRVRGHDADVVFSAVYLRARRGDPAASLVLEHARARLAPNGKEPA